MSSIALATGGLIHLNDSRSLTLVTSGFLGFIGVNPLITKRIGITSNIQQDLGFDGSVPSPKSLVASKGDTVSFQGNILSCGIIRADTIPDTEIEAQIIISTTAQ